MENVAFTEQLLHLLALKNLPFSNSQLKLMEEMIYYKGQTDSHHLSNLEHGNLFI